MTTYTFSEKSTTLFTFQPTLDGVVYNASLPWNIFGKRFYVNIRDYNGNLVANIPLIESSSSPNVTTKSSIENITWTNGIATVTPTAGSQSASLLLSELPGTIVNITVSGVLSTKYTTSTPGFNGSFVATIAGDGSSLTYALPAYPGDVTSLNNASIVEAYAPVNIIAGYFNTSVMYYFLDQNTLEVLP